MASNSAQTPDNPDQTLYIYNPFKPYFIYNPRMPLSEAEQRVIAAGYPFVSTTILGRNGTVNGHSHHSRNTHLIITGSITIVKSRDDLSKFREVATGPGLWVTIPGKVDHIGAAGEDGCTFVEGHTVLSPTTGRRFFDRGTIVQVYEGTPGAFTFGDGR
ncbi:hypothetical protein LTR85_002655 [Meristemomyces frigidus]|nr:hypothetical protein LTR85_002655 [Meristemomyces frigidus]